MKRTIFPLAFLFITNITFGQVKTVYYKDAGAIQQIKYLNIHSETTHKIELPTFDIKNLIDEDEFYAKNKLDVPYRFGKGFDVNISLTDGEWQDIENGRLWLMEFKSNKAYSINFVFDNFYLPEGAELYITNLNNTMLYGPVTSKQNTKNGFFLTDFIMGDDVTIIIFEPYPQKGNTRLSIKRVVHAYKDMFSSFNYGNLNGSESCENNISCWPDYNVESNAVALVLLSSGTELCSGSLLTTTAQIFRPYFLTAFHCIDIAGGDLSSSDFRDGFLQEYEIDDANNWLFKFQYKMTSCSGSTATEGITYNGATLRSAWNSTDFALTELTHSPIGNSNISWLGWDRSVNIPSSGASIHHPEGDVMKISFESGQFQTSSWGGIDNHWLVSFDDGVVEHGSSGASILDQNDRVVGQLHGNQYYDRYETHCSQPRAEFGRLNLSWAGGGEEDNRLSNWLDPTGTGVLTANTLSGPYISGSTLVCSSPNKTYTLINRPLGTTVHWTNSNNLIYVSGDTSDNFIVRASTTKGLGWVQPTIYSGSDSVVLPQYQVWVGAPTNATGHSIYYVNEYGLDPDIYCTEDSYAFYLQDDNIRYSNNFQSNGLFTLYYDWIIDGYSETTDSYTHTVFTGFTEKTTTLRVKMRNTCGSSLYYRYFYDIVECSSRWGFSLSPNPAEDLVQIDFFETDLSGIKSPIIEQATPSCEFSIVLYDNLQRPLKTSKSFGERVMITTSDLLPGSYIVKVNNSKKQLSQVLIIK